jgi:UDP-N-acetylglucosamine acyltransferase
VHIAHDCSVGDEVILANAATLAGHVEVGNSATVGAFSGVHQFCRVGVHAFIGGYSVLTRDVLPFVKTVGIRNEAKIYGINSIGLERKGFSETQLKALNSAYRTLFRKGLKLKEAIAQIRAAGEMSPDVEILVEFVETCERGFVR